MVFTANENLVFISIRWLCEGEFSSFVLNFEKNGTFGRGEQKRLENRRIHAIFGNNYSWNYSGRSCGEELAQKNILIFKN